VALLSGASEAFVYDSLKKTKETKKSKKIFGRSHTFKLIGIMVAAPIGSIIAANISLRAPMYLFSIPLFISALISLTFKEPKTSKRVESTRYIKILKDGVGFFRKNKTLQILAVDMIVISVMGYFMIWLYQPMLKQAGIDIAYFGFVHSGLVIAQIILANTFGVFEKILKSKKGFVLMGSLTVGVMYIIGGLTTFVPLVLLSIILGGGFGLTRKPLFSGYINKYIPSPKRATVLSTVSMFQRLLTTVLNPLIGVMVDWSLNYTLISLGTVAIFFAFISRVKEEHLID
jgi:cyanate permease